MLSDLEMAMALVERQDHGAVEAVKTLWQNALEDASRILKWPRRFIVQYNPAIWRGSRYVVGLRRLSGPMTDLIIFDFATPNYTLQFDCFGPNEAKLGVMLHEIAHMIDDERWGFDLGGLEDEAREFIAREQRAELLAFAASPVGVFQANRALIRSTARMLDVDLCGNDLALAAVETAGHAGIAGTADPIAVCKEIQSNGIAVDMVLEHYLSNFVFSLAGLATAPDDNEHEGLGIKRSQDLSKARTWLCRYLRQELDLEELEELLGGAGYYAFIEEGYDPLGILDLSTIDRNIAMENLSIARRYFRTDPCYSDLHSVVVELERRINK